jgi:hypothetical protein
MAWTGLRWLFALFFFATGVAIATSLLIGWPGLIHQPTASAQALDNALHQSGFMDPLIGASYLVGGTALALRRTAPLGLILLAPTVVVIFFFDTFLAASAPVGIAVVAIWGILALRHFSAFRGLWSYGLDKPAPPR